jgi:hypothetical protein
VVVGFHDFYGSDSVPIACERVWNRVPTGELVGCLH